MITTRWIVLEAPNIPCTKPSTLILNKLELRRDLNLIALMLNDISFSSILRFACFFRI